VASSTVIKRMKFLSIFIFLFAFSFVGAVDKYDYIVLGGGTAGCVVAGRLSENPNITVLLIERGQDVTDDPTVAVPTKNAVLPLVDITLLPTEHIHSTEPYLSSLQNPTYVPFALGGGPAVSGSFWGRGEPSNYDQWAEMTGDSSLTYENLLPYFKKTENVATSDSSSSERGRTGPVQVTFLDSNDTNVTPLVLLQSQAFNVSVGLDYATSAGSVGIWPMQRSLYRDPAQCSATHGPCTRQSAYATYIKPYLSTRSNLKIVSSSNALQLVFSANDSNQVIGVKYLVDGASILAKARKEVIVSLGTINSPKLLLLSGVDLPGIGKNIHDHFYLNMAFIVPGISITAPSSVHISFFKSGFNGNHVDIEVAWGLLPAGPSAAILIAQNIQVRNTTNGGWLKLRSNNPFERVDLQFNFDPALLDPQIWAFRKIREWVSTIAIEQSPGLAAVPANATDAQIRAYLSKSGLNFFHLAGSCRMGKLDRDPLAVVDTNFKVHGYDNLRVVDNSVQPLLVSTHPSATAMMLGERAAAMILQDN
jgi:choline dehydrogenase